MILRADYAAHEVFVAPARACNQVWRLLLGFMVIGVGYVALTQMFFQVVQALLGSGSLQGDLLGGRTPGAMYLLLFSFAFLAMPVVVVVRLLHRRPVPSLFGPTLRFISQLTAVSIAMMALGAAVFVLPPWGLGGDLSLNMPVGQWLLLLPLSMAAVLVQVGTEELLFRGYIQQQLAARFRSPLVWMVLPSLVFATGHYLPQSAGDNALVIALWAGLFGILMADLTARAGSLGPAIAVHFWNNVSAILIVSLPDDLSGLALFLAPFGMADADAIRTWLPVDFALMLTGWLAARVAIRR
jgi:uncharacterized protein